MLGKGRDSAVTACRLLIPQKNTHQDDHERLLSLQKPPFWRPVGTCWYCIWLVKPLYVVDESTYESGAAQVPRVQMGVCPSKYPKSLQVDSFQKAVWSTSKTSVRFLDLLYLLRGWSAHVPMTIELIQSGLVHSTLSCLNRS